MLEKTTIALFASSLLFACNGGGDNEDTTASNDEADDGGDDGGTMDGADDGQDDTPDDGPDDDAPDDDADTGTPSGCAAKGEVDSYLNVDAAINEDTTWSCDTVYVLAQDSHVFVNGATLTIEPGTTILGSTGSALVIEKDAMLVAEGTADAPIVMTSFQESPARGDWGGLVMLGEAPANIGTGQAEGFATAPTYGGSNAAHNCGALAYLRVEYAGFAISEGNELNGITFYACGTETSAHHVQSHMGSDDGIECFGGGFDMDHIVITGADDDALDLDQGYAGTIQYLFIHQAPGSGDNGFEWSNQGTDFTAEPLTSPTVCNGTIVGSDGDKSKGFTFKEGNEAAIYSTIFLGSSGEAGVIANAETEAVATGGGIVLNNNIFFGSGTPAFTSSTEGWDDAAWEAWVLDAANNNLTDDPELVRAEFGDPDITPGAVASGAGAVGGGCEDNDYIGAVDPAGDNWTMEPWINYTP